MASLLHWLGGAAKRVENTVNNDVVAPVRRDVIQPIQRVGSSGIHQVQGGVAQVNPLDSGRTYSSVMQHGAAYAPKPNMSAVYQAFHNGASNFAGNNIVKPLAQFPIDAANQLYNRGVAPVLHTPHLTPQQTQGISKLSQKVGATGSLHQTVGSGLQTALTIGSGGLSRGIESGVAKLVPKTAPKLATKLIPKVASNAAIGAGFNASAAGSQGASIKDIAKSAALGAGLGAAVPIAAPVVKAGAKQVAKAADSRVPLNDKGYIKVGYPKASDLPEHVQDSIKSYNYSNRTSAEQRIKANKLTPSDIGRTKVNEQLPNFSATDIKTLAKSIPEFNQKPVMTFHSKGAVSLDRYGHQVKAPALKLKTANHDITLNAENYFPAGTDLSQLKDGEQVDFTPALKANGGKIPSIVESKPGVRLPGTGRTQQVSSKGSVAPETPVQTSARLHKEKLAKNNLTQNEYAGLHQDVTDLENAASQAHHATGEALDAAPKDVTGKLTPEGHAQVTKALNAWTKAQDNHLAALNKIRAVDGKKPIVPDSHMVAQPTQVAKTAEHPIARAFSKHYTPSANPSAAEKFAAEYIRSNPEKAMADYNARVTEKFGSHKIVAGDEAKHIIPGFDATKSVAYHEPGSALAKVKLDNLLADKSTAHQPVLQMSGGTGAGKTSALLRQISPDDYAATIDTNSNVFGSAKNKVDRALSSGRKVQIAHVQRDVIDAFKNGVIPRTAKEGRLITPGTHIDTHIGANETFHRLRAHYNDNPNVDFRAVENKTGQAPQGLANLAKINYNRGEAIKQLRKEIHNAHQQGTITTPERDAYLAEQQKPSTGYQAEATEKRQANTKASSKPQRPVPSQKVSPTPPSLRSAHSGVEAPKVPLRQPRKSIQGEDTLNVSKIPQTPASKNIQPPKVPLVEQRSITNIPRELGEVSFPNNTPITPVVNTRGFTQSVRDSKNFTPQLKKAINPNKDAASNYAAITDKQTIENTKNLVSQGLDKAHADVLQRLQSSARPDKQLVTDAGTVMQHLDTQGNTAAAQQIHDLLAEHLTNAGQTSQAASLLLRRSPDGIYHKAIADLNKAKVNVTPDIENQLAAHREAIRATAPDTVERDVAIQQLRQFVSKNIPTSKLNNAFAFWRAGLLTGPRTVGKILTSHGIHLPLEKLKDVPASLIDRAVGKISGQRSLILTTKGGAGLGEGAKAGFGKQGYLRTGIDIQPGNNSIEFHNNANYGQSVPGKIAQAYVDGIGRLHGSLYKPFFGYGHLNSLYSLAKAESRNKGLAGDAAAQFEQNFVRTPPAWAQDIAKHDAENLTFQQETALGKLASAIQSHGGIVGKVIAPFTRIPSAIATDLFSYSPAGGLKSIYDGIVAAKSDVGWTIADQRKFAQGLGRSITGTAAVIPGYLLYQKGLMNLAYPTDPKEQKLWQLEGRTANSIKVAGKWRSLGSLGPVGSVLSIGGYFAESQQRGESVGQSALNALAGGLKTIEEQPYVSGISGATNAIQDPGRYLTNLEKQYAGSVIPTGIAQVASSFDSQQRQANNAGDTVKSKIPGLRETLQPKTNALGQPVPSGETGPGALVDPFYSSKALPQSALVTELQRLNDAGEGTMPSTVPAKNNFDGVKTNLSKPQAQALGRQIDQKVNDLWNQTINSSVYKNLADDQKKQMLTNVMSDTTSAEKRQYAADNSLGQYSPDFTGQGKPLSARQQAILTNSFDPNSYAPKQATSTKVPGLKIPKLKKGSTGKAKSTKSKVSRAKGTRTKAYKAPKIKTTAMAFKLPNLRQPKYKTPGLKNGSTRTTAYKKPPMARYKTSKIAVHSKNSALSKLLNA